MTLTLGAWTLTAAEPATCPMQAASCPMQQQAKSGCCEKPAVQQLAAGAAKAYPLQTCLVSDEKLGEMGAPYAFVHKGREVKLCCKSCLKDFNKDPETYLKKLDAAEKKLAEKK